MSDFSEEQLRMIRHRGKPLIVFAGPGTGKTKTLVQRTIGILQGEPDADVAFITFTRASCRDTNTRIRCTLEATEQTDRTARASTLHGFAKHLAHRFADKLGLTRDFIILAPRREGNLIAKEIIEDFGLDITPTELRELLSELRSTGTVRSPHPMTQEQMNRAAAKYDVLLRLYDASDMEGLVLGAERYLREGGAVAERLFMHVDEYQDLNPLDQKLVRAILETDGAEIVVVGDDAQSIYGGRHAHPAGIRTLMADGSWERAQFTQCFRLPPHVLVAAEALLQQHRAPLQKRSFISTQHAQERVPIFQCTSEGVEARWVAKRVTELLRTGHRLRTTEPLKKQDIMVLCPSKSLVEKFSETLETQGIATRKKKGQEIPEDMWQLLLLLRLVKGDDSLALRQWLELIGISLSDICRIRQEAEQKGERFFEYVRQTGPAAWQAIVKALDGLRLYRDDARMLAQQLKVATAFQLPPSLIEQLEALLPAEAEELLSVEALVTRVYERYGIIESEDEVPDEDKVLVTTLHSSKGLEAQAVFVVEMTDRYMPNPARDRDEEVRVLYVAMTRTLQLLYFSFSDRFVRGKGRLGIEAMSPFLQGIQQYLAVKGVAASDAR